MFGVRDMPGTSMRRRYARPRERLAQPERKVRYRTTLRAMRGVADALRVLRLVACVHHEELGLEWEGAMTLIVEAPLRSARGARQTAVRASARARRPAWPLGACRRAVPRRRVVDGWWLSRCVRVLHAVGLPDHPLAARRARRTRTRERGAILGSAAATPHAGEHGLPRRCRRVRLAGGVRSGARSGTRTRRAPRCSWRTGSRWRGTPPTQTRCSGSPRHSITCGRWRSRSSSTGCGRW